MQELSSKINQVTDDLTKELQRSPSIEEIAQRLDTNVEEVLEAMESSSAYSSVPLEGGGSGADGDETPSERLRLCSQTISHHLYQHSQQLRSPSYMTTSALIGSI